MLPGCAAELLSDEGYALAEDTVWAREQGRRKYICTLRLSGEMEASLSCYFSTLEELYALDYELKSYEPESHI